MTPNFGETVFRQDDFFIRFQHLEKLGAGGGAAAAQANLGGQFTFDIVRGGPVRKITLYHT